jgi:hypothetical protein
MVQIRKKGVPERWFLGRFTAADDGNPVARFFVRTGKFYGKKSLGNFPDNFFIAEKIFEKFSAGSCSWREIFSWDLWVPENFLVNGYGKILWAMCQPVPVRGRIQIR